MRITPEFSVEFARKHLFYLKQADQLETCLEGLRKARLNRRASEFVKRDLYRNSANAVAPEGCKIVRDIIEIGGAGREVVPQPGECMPADPDLHLRWKL